MINEVNHKEPRLIKPSQEIDKYPIWASSVGMHSTYKKWRATDLEILGPGILLYLKMLKYWGVLFLLFFLISIPSISIYQQGTHYSEHPVSTSRMFASTTMGNLGVWRNIEVAYLDLSESKDSYTFPIACPSDKNIGDLIKFGLA